MKFMMNESLDNDKLFSEVYNALANIAFKLRPTENEMSQAIAWFDSHFWEDEADYTEYEDDYIGDLDESLDNLNGDLEGVMNPTMAMAKESSKKTLDNMIKAMKERTPKNPEKIGAEEQEIPVQKALQEGVEDKIYTITLDAYLEDEEDILDTIEAIESWGVTVDSLTADEYDNLTISGTKEALLKYLEEGYGDVDEFWIEEYYPQLLESIDSPVNEERVNEVRLMHETMLSMNNEDAYMRWIYTMPDEPEEEDFEWFAEDEDEYANLKNTFMRLLKTYKKDGLYKPSEEVVDFVNGLGIEIDIL